MEVFHEVIRKGDLESLQRMVYFDNSLVDITDDKGKTAVTIAIEHQKVDIVKWLTENGCRLSMSEVPRKTAFKPNPDLSCSDAQNQSSFFSSSKVPADSTATNECVQQSIYPADERNTEGKKQIYNGRVVVARHSPQTTFYPPLLAAVSAGSYNMVKLVLGSQRAAVDESFNNITPLLKACMEGHTHFVSLLIKYGANVNGVHVTGGQGEDDSQWFGRPLYHAVQRGHGDIVELLVMHGACYLNVVPLDTYSFHVADPSTVSHRALATLLELAVRRCQPSVVGFLIDSFRSEITDLGRYYALVWSVKFQQTGMTEVLIEKLYPDSYDKQKDECCDKYRQVLRIAVRECPPGDETVPLLLVQRFGRTLFEEEEGFFIILHSAVLRSLPQLVLKLLEIAKDPCCNFDVSRYESWPDLCSAALYYGNKKILSALYDSGCLDLSTQCDGESAFFEAIFCGKNGSSVFEVLSWLVECGLDPSACDNNKMQPVHAAVTHRLISAVEALCQLGVDANARMGIDDLPTPLHLQFNLRVLQLGCDLDLDMIKVLIGHGADLAMENRKGYTPISILFWLLHTNICLQEADAGRGRDVHQGQGQGQDHVTSAIQPNPSHTPSTPAHSTQLSPNDSSSTLGQNTGVPQNTNNVGQTALVSQNICSREQTGGVSQGVDTVGDTSDVSQTADTMGDESRQQCGQAMNPHLGDRDSEGQNGADIDDDTAGPPSITTPTAPQPVTNPTYLQAGSPWRSLIEILVDRFGVELFSMGAARLTGPDRWRKVYASLLHCGIDMGHLPTLRTMCWVTVRKQLGGVLFMEKVEQLPLPQAMKTYLRCL